MDQYIFQAGTPGNILGPIKGAVTVDSYSPGATLQLGNNGKPFLLQGRDAYYAPADGWDQVLVTGTATLMVYRAPLWLGSDLSVPNERPGARGSVSPLIRFEDGAGRGLARRSEVVEWVRAQRAFSLYLTQAAVAGQVGYVWLWNNAPGGVRSLLIQRLRLAAGAAGRIYWQLSGAAPGASALAPNGNRYSGGPASVYSYVQTGAAAAPPAYGPNLGGIDVAGAGAASLEVNEEIELPPQSGIILYHETINTLLKVGIDYYELPSPALGGAIAQTET